ncbi:MAG: hypothetical protein QOJ16_4044 [Acidobacteriota bacterium]|jgi:hypothetical protein|nr:hypothetical protein [Acidobacteriota bacterium]
MPETPNPVPAVNPGDAPPDPMATLKLAGAWLFVGIPAAWGIWQVFQKSLALFR